MPPAQRESSILVAGAILAPLMTALQEFLETLQWATDLTTVNIAAGVFQTELFSLIEAAGVSL